MGDLHQRHQEANNLAGPARQRPAPAEVSWSAAAKSPGALPLPTEEVPLLPAQLRTWAISMQRAYGNRATAAALGRTSGGAAGPPQRIERSPGASASIRVHRELVPHSSPDAVLRAQAPIYRGGRTPIMMPDGRVESWDIRPATAAQTGPQFDDIAGRFGQAGLDRTLHGLTLSRGPSFTADALQHAPAASTMRTGTDPPDASQLLPSSSPVIRREATPDEKAHADADKRDLCIAQPVDESRARCKFTSEQEIMVRVVQQYALRVCSKAIAAVNMPGNEEQVKRIAQEYFGLKIKLSDKTRRTLVSAIRSVHDTLEGSDIQCATCQEDRCNTWGAIAFVDDGRTHMGLCPRFFNSRLHKPYLTPRFLIHESGHLARLDQHSSIREEFYCDMGKPTEEEKCPVPDAIHNVDAWSHFIEDLAATI